MGIVGNLTGKLAELPVICFVVNADSGGGRGWQLDTSRSLSSAWTASVSGMISLFPESVQEP